MIEFPGTQDAAHLSFHFLNRLTDLLISKGLITSAEMVALLDQLAGDLRQDTNPSAERNAGYVSNTMIAKHQPRE